MARNRFDETWHRLREWTKGQTPSERLAAQILIHEGFQSLDPSHPLGGRDGGKDAIADKHGVRFAMAVYFPRGQQTFNDIRTKFEGDCVGAKQNSAKGIAFVTNQELTLGQRETLKTSAEPLVVELYHRDRITTILDTPDMASVRQQFLDIEADSRPAIHLGGEGGRAPSAGGGGGAAIGPRSQGGRGGDGGGRRIEDGEYTLPWIEDVSRPQFMDQQFQQGWEDFLGFVPGAGGGGAGAIGDGVSGGDGGSGGEWVSAQIDMAALRNAGFDRIEYTVGKGGAGPRLPGQHAPDGEDTVVNFLAKDGTILKTIRAAGGRGAKSGAPHLPDGVAELSASDIDGGFRITTLMTVNAAEHRDGLVFVLGGDWVRFHVPSIPFDAVWNVVCGARWRTFERAVSRGLFLSLINPTGRETSCQTLIIPAETTGWNRWIRPIGATFDAEGTWTLRVHSGGFLLAELGIPVLRVQADAK